MTLSRPELASQVEFLRVALAGARLQEVRVPDADRVVLGLRTPGRTHWLLLCAAPGLSRIHTVAARPRNPLSPVVFQGLLRKELPPALIALDLVEQERIVLLRFGGPPGVPARVMILEIFGGGGNLVLTDEGLAVLGRARSPRGPGSRADRGTVWTPPQARTSRAQDPAEPAIDGLLRDRYRRLEEESAAALALRQALQRLRGDRKRLARLARRQRADIDQAGNPATLRAHAELLRGNYHLLGRGLESVRVTDWADPAMPEVELAVDPRLGPAAQLEAAFRRAGRAERAREESTGRLQRTEEALAALAQTESALLSGERLPSAAPTPERPAARAKRTTRLPFRSWWTAAGTEIRVGRSAADNDALTLHNAKGNDVWLHVRGRPGAHVVIRAPGRAPQPELLLLAAQLALVHSGLADGARAEVTWTRVKHVKKPRGLPPGKVLVTQERVLYVETDRAALEQLRGEAP